MNPIFVLAIFLISSSSGGEFLKKYTESELKTKLQDSNHLVLFFVPWGGETKSPVWEDLASKYNSLTNSDLTVGKVDCSTEPTLCSEENISEYPTLKLFKSGSKEGIFYRGVNDVPSVSFFISEQLHEFKSDPGVYGARAEEHAESKNGLHILEDDSWEEIVASGFSFINFCTPWHSRCMDLEPIWANLAKEFMHEDVLTMGICDCSLHKSICNEFEVRAYPSLLWLNDGLLAEKYASRERDFESIKKFIMKKLGKKEPPKKAESHVVLLDKTTFYPTMEKENLLIVLFYATWSTPSEKMAIIWEELGTHFKGSDKVKIGKLECVDNKVLCDNEDIEEFPSIRIYRKGEFEGPYVGPMHTKDIMMHINNAIEYKKIEL